MKLFGLIGYPLEHSFSPDYFREKFRREQIQAQYRLFPLASIGEFPSLVRQFPRLCGLNVTIPYKRQIMPFLWQIKDEAAEIGSVNTIAFIREKGEPVEPLGFNTDAYGLEQALKPFLNEDHRNALILGTGGSAHTAGYVLRKLGIHVQWVSRSEHNENGQYSDSDVLTYGQLTPEVVAHNRLIINTTPLGMYPHTDGRPDIPYDGIGPHHLLFDLIYNPPLTAFLREGQKRGATVENGYNMLRHQAEQAWHIWNQFI